MTDHELEQRLRAWYRAEVGEATTAPLDLRSSIAEIPKAPPFLDRRSGNRRSVILLAAAALAGALVVGGVIAVGSGLVRLPDTRLPSSPPQASVPANPAPSGIDVSRSPTPVPTSTASEPGSWTLSPHGGGSYGSTATLLEDGRVLVAGGEGDITNTASAALYDPSTGQWSATGSMHVARRGHVATRLADGRVLVAGGWNLGTGQAFASAEIFDPSTGTWTETGSMTRWRYAAKATLLADGRVLVVGGLISGGGQTKGAEIYDPRTGTWSWIPSMSAPPATATLLQDGKVLVTHGGQIAPELFDPASEGWTAAAIPGQAPGPFQAATLLADGRVLVLSLAGDSFDGAELYEPGSDTWTSTSLPLTVHDPATLGPATLLADGSVLVVGRTGSARYDPADGSWSTVTAQPTSSYFNEGRLIRLLDGRVLAIGPGPVGLFDPTGTP
jgi:Kelch motif/Galactose oxidase, central domain